MKKTLRYVGIAACAVVLFAGVGIARADAPVVTMNPIGTITTGILPLVYNVTGTVQHNPNLNPVNDVTLWINSVQESMQTIPNGSGDIFNFSLPWNITAAGTYQVMVTARHGGCPACTGSDSETVDVIYNGPVVITQCPAAPAIASDYLRNTLGWKPVSGKFKSIMNLVAGQTGSQGSLWAAHACEAWYRPAVINYVDGLI